MCFVLAIVSAVFAVNFLMEGETMPALGSGAVALLFGTLMLRNILKTKKEREHKK